MSFFCLEKELLCPAFMRTASALLAAALLACPAAAEDFPPSLSGLSGFERAVASRWRADCPSDYGDGVRAFAVSTVFEGLRKLYALNPELVRRAVANAAGRSVVLECRGVDVPGAGGAYRRRLFLSDQIFLGEAAAFAARGGGDAGGGDAVWSRFIVLHEFLHLAGLPAPADHDVHDGRVQRDLDLIYACGAQVFPAVAIHHARAGGEDESYFNTREACETCATSRWGFDGPADPDFVEARRARCAALP
jgi:hypothetical protein